MSRLTGTTFSKIFQATRGNRHGRPVRPVRVHHVRQPEGRAPRFAERGHGIGAHGHGVVTRRQEEGAGHLGEVSRQGITVMSFSQWLVEKGLETTSKKTTGTDDMPNRPRNIFTKRTFLYWILW